MPPSEMAWRVEGEHILFLNPNGATRNTRPATEQEIELWRNYKALSEDFAAGKQNCVDNHITALAGLDADKRSLLESNEAYRNQQVRLADIINADFPSMAPHGSYDDYIGAAIELLGNYAQFKTALGPVGGPLDTLATGLVTDAYGVPGSVGANPTARVGRPRKPSKKEKK